ncbi:MAG: hypothetical protein KBS62_07105 [Oscillospiraceae bacterium]|nr:hypothetical protein [Candidatus Ruminococcus equi]
MKRRVLAIILFMLAVMMCACSNTQNTSTDNDAITQAKSDYNPYKEENIYDIDSSFFSRNDGTDYGTLDTDVEYFSTVAGDKKYVNVLLPPEYDDEKEYPVMYMIHGWGADYKAHLSDGSYLHLLYGNMYKKGLVVPMIIVSVDMYSGLQSEKENLNGEQMRAAYDKTVDDIALDLMPFIEEKYPVKNGRKFSAVAGVSEGGAKSLCTGFKWLDKFGYIAGIAPDTGVIPTQWHKGTYWNIPYFEELPTPTKDNMPIYLYLAVGSEDPWNIKCTHYYSEVLDDMNIPHTMDYVEGFGHDSDFWGECMYNFMHKVFR